jgi:zinc protease
LLFKCGSASGAPTKRRPKPVLAHVLEHMLFKGTARRDVGEIPQDVERAGGHINAWTSHDETVYHITLARRFAERGLDILADAIQTPRSIPGNSTASST